MSRKPGHPFFVARMPTGEGCGHQHQRQHCAHNCGLALLERAARHRQPLAYVHICEATSDGREKHIQRLQVEESDAPDRLRV